MHNKSGRFKLKRGMLLWELLGGVAVLAVIAVIIVLIGKKIAIEEKKLAQVREIQAASKPVDAVNVIMMPLKRQQVVDTIVLPGRFEPFDSSVVSAQIEGQVLSRLKEGTAVKKGDILIVIDDSDYRREMLEKKATYEQARQNYERKKTLRSRKVNAEAELEKATALYNSAKNNYEKALLSFERCNIKSPISGVVDRVEPEIGEIVGKNTEVATVVKLGKLKIEIGIPEKDVDYVRSTEQCEIYVDAAKETVVGKKTYLSYLPAEGSQVYTLRLEVDNVNGQIRPGMYGKVQVIREIRDNFIIPLYAVLVKDSQHYVFVQKPYERDSKSRKDPRNLQKVGRKEVSLGVVQGAEVEITGGLVAGESLAVVGQRNIDEETIVNVVREVDSLKDLSN